MFCFPPSSLFCLINTELQEGSVRWICMFKSCLFFIQKPFLLLSTLCSEFFKRLVKLNHLPSGPDGWFIFFSLNDRLRNCRGAAATSSQLVTATAIPCHHTASKLYCCVLPQPLPTQLLHSLPFLHFFLDSRSWFLI